MSACHACRCRSSPRFGLAGFRFTKIRRRIHASDIAIPPTLVGRNAWRGQPVARRAGLLCLAPPFPIQATIRNSTAEALGAEQRDFSQFVAHQLRRQGAPIDFPLDVADLQDLKDAKIEYGFAVHTIDPPELLAGRGSMQSMARHANQWRFVITLHQRAIGMTTVEKTNGRYETVAYGAAVLAKDLDAVAAVHGNADKSNLRFLRIYQARSDLLEVIGQDGRERFAPLHSARESLLLAQRSKDGNSGLLDESELVQPLRAAVKQNMAASR